MPFPKRSIQLTPYPQGSLRELWQISFPLIISLMSASMMLFLDRLFLAHYSITALNAAAQAGAAVQFLQFWAIATAAIAEVFVGRYNGAGKLHRLGQPVWQMIWLSLGTFIVYLPIAFFAGPYLFHIEIYQEMEIEFFAIVTSFIPLAAISAALSSFYIGRGRVRFVTAVMLISNLINVFADIVLIFGISPWIPSYGITGAAWATVIALFSQAVILFAGFLSKNNREIFGTGKWNFNFRLFKSCLSIGLPNAVAHSIEILSWVLIFDLMAHLGSDYMTVVTVAQSILFLFTFITEGLSKGASAIASNFIGSDKHHLVWKLLRSGVKFYTFAFLILGSILVLHPSGIINWFIASDSAIEGSLRSACFWVWIYFLFDGVSWLLIGLLTAAGDTRFVMKIGTLTPLLFALAPVYFFVFKGNASADITWMIIALYAIASCFIYLFRFRGEKWKEAIAV